MFNIGESITFFEPYEEFNHVQLNNIENFVDGLAYYKVTDMDDDWIDVVGQTSTRTIHVDNVYNEYLLFTKEQLKQHLLTIKSNSSYSDICAKIRQLYRKQEFKFQGV